MSRSLGRELPPELTAELSRPSKARDQALILATVDAGLCPRLALISLAEIAVVNRRRLLVALWAGSNSAGNLDRAGAATLFVMEQGIAYSILLRQEETVPLEVAGQRLVAVTASVEEVRSDEVGYATLTSTIAFDLTDPSDVLPRWQDLGDHLVRLADERRARGQQSEE